MRSGQIYPGSMTTWEPAWLATPIMSMTYLALRTTPQQFRAPPRHHYTKRDIRLGPRRLGGGSGVVHLEKNIVTIYDGGAQFIPASLLPRSPPDSGRVPLSGKMLADYL